MKEDLIIGLREARKALCEAIQGLPPQVRDSELIVNWTVKDLVGHIAFWRRIEREIVQAALEGREPSLEFSVENQGDLDEVNAREVALRRGRTWEEVWGELEREEEAFLSLVKSVSEEELHLPVSAPWPDPGTVADCIRVEIDHELTHARRIREWRRASI